MTCREGPGNLGSRFAMCRHALRRVHDSFLQLKTDLSLNPRVSMNPDLGRHEDLVPSEVHPHLTPELPKDNEPEPDLTSQPVSLVFGRRALEFSGSLLKEENNSSSGPG